MSDLAFTDGDMLTVLRDAERDPFGDAVTAAAEHQIGPASNPRRPGSMSDPREPRAATNIPVRIPAGQDVRKQDRIRFPDGLIGVVVNAPRTPRNPFTGWAPHVVFDVKAAQ